MRARFIPVSRWSPLFVLVLASLVSNEAAGQAASSISSVSRRPFVLGFQPVVGRNGAVGGVLVDANGIVATADALATQELGQRRARALQVVSDDVRRYSDVRKVSLKRLEAAIIDQQRHASALPDDIQLLAGLQRIEYVFIYPERQDIVLAGPAEGWRVDQQGHVVGQTTGRSVMQLSDLVVCLRAADSDLAQEAIACSIDPTPEGVERVQRALLRRGWRPTQSTLQHLERLLGPQEITLRGLPATCPLARTLVAADVRMKRLAMGLDAKPLSGLPSYFDLLRSERARRPGSATPRWWLEPDYDSLAHDPSGLAWRIGPGSVQAFAAEDDSGEALQDAGNPAARWAELFTQNYESLALRWPIFGELQNGMDAAIVAALLVQQNLLADARCELPVLLGSGYLQTPDYSAPKSIPAHAAAIRSHGQWIVSISGGVHVDALEQLQHVATDDNLGQLRQHAAPAAKAWWWD